MPLPRQRGESAAQKAVLICRRGYALSFNPSARNPDWVMERLAAGDLSGKASRSNNFGGDPLLNAADADDDDYLRSGYDRGHQAPAGDAKFDQTIMDQSFFFSNMAPQIGIGFNRGAWKYLEETVRAWVLCGGHPDLYVVTGPIYGASTKTIGNDAVRVPESFFKIVYDPTSGRAVGFVLPNRRIGSRLDDLQAWVRPIADIETDTGLDFFRSFAKRRQTELEAHAGAAWGHVGTCASDSDD
jgi:endonuclease G